MSTTKGSYRGRIAPSPTGYLHLGHAATFWTAHQRAVEAGGTLVLRSEDLDFSRCRREFAEAMVEDLKWFGIDWQEGPDLGGPFAPYNQSERLASYTEAWHRLLSGDFIYPCSCSRRDLLQAGAPHPGDEEPIYPGTCRPRPGHPPARVERSGVSWRFRVPAGEAVCFEDRRQGPQSFVAGEDFGDFVIWRKDDLPAYQLAVVVDDAAMRISEVVRGEDLLVSTARQILLYRALDLPQSAFYHCPLVTDESGARLAKRSEALSLRALRKRGKTPAQLREKLGAPQELF